MTSRRTLKLFNWFNFLINFNFFSTISILYFAFITHSYAQAAFVLATIPVSTALLEIPTGIYSDMVGRKNTIVLGTIFALLSVIFYGIGMSFWILFIGAIFHGAARACFSGNNDAYLHNLLEMDNLVDVYHHHRGKQETFFMLGTSVGAVLSGFIAAYSFPLAVWLSAIPMTLALILSLKFVSIPKVEHESYNIFEHLKESLEMLKKNSTLRLLSIGTIFGDSFGRTAYDFQAAVYNAIWPLWAVGFAKALSEWVAIPGTYFSGKVIDKVGKFKVMLISDLYGWFSTFIAVLIPTKMSPAIISTSAVLWGPGEVARVTLFQKEFTERQRATIASLNSFVGSLIYAGFAYGIGLFADHYGPIKAMLLIQIFILPTLFISWLLYKRNKDI